MTIHPGIATYSIAGAQHGLALLWTALITWPLMAFAQMMCARIGMVTGRGLAGAMHRRIPRPLIVVAAIALFAANSINVGADLSGMADAAEMLTKINSHIYVVIFGVGISAGDNFFSISPDRHDFEMARPRFVRLRHHRVYRSSGLVKSRARGVHSIVAEEP